MLDILELAREKCEEEEFKKGEEEGLKKSRETLQEMVLDTIFELSGKLPIDIIEKVKSISHFEILKIIHRQAMECKNIEQFRDILNQTTTS